MYLQDLKGWSDDCQRTQGLWALKDQVSSHGIQTFCLTNFTAQVSKIDALVVERFEYCKTLIIRVTLFSRGHQLGYIHETLF